MQLSCVTFYLIHTRPFPFLSYFCHQSYPFKPPRPSASAITTPPQTLPSTLKISSQPTHNPSNTRILSLTPLPATPSHRSKTCPFRTSNARTSTSHASTTRLHRPPVLVTPALVDTLSFVVAHTSPFPPQTFFRRCTRYTRRAAVHSQSARLAPFLARLCARGGWRMKSSWAFFFSAGRGGGWARW